MIKDIYGNSESFVVKIADSDEERSQGLSNKKFLFPGTAMLFIFNKEDRVGIWMKNMHFSINIYWFKKDLRLDLVLKDISPDTYPNVFYSQGNVLYVLETKAGYVLDNVLDLDLTYVNKHDKNIKTLW
jgi:uncharacterized membrane protein (UPF0127 family)